MQVCYHLHDLVDSPSAKSHRYTLNRILVVSKPVWRPWRRKESVFYQESNSGRTASIRWICVMIQICLYLSHLATSKLGSIVPHWKRYSEWSRQRRYLIVSIFYWEFLLQTTAFRTALMPTQPPIQWVPGALSLVVKRPGREADHSPPSRAEVKECVELYIHSPNTPSWHAA